jgi:hypothetical protein
MRVEVALGWLLGREYSEGVTEDVLPLLTELPTLDFE